MTSRFQLLLVSISLGLFHCADPVSAGLTAFHAASYPEAARAFDRIDVAQLSRKDAARFQLYSGLTALALGDADSAVPRFEALRRAVEREASLLGAEDQVRLEIAWRTLGLMPGESSAIPRGLQ